VVKEIEGFGVRAYAHEADVSDEKQVTAGRISGRSLRGDGSGVRCHGRFSLAPALTGCRR
jgi:hypothetical protein